MPDPKPTRAGNGKQREKASKSPPGLRPPAARRSDRFLAQLSGYKRVTLVTHVNPDPDSLGSMLGLAHLVEKKTRHTHAPDTRRTHLPRRKPSHGGSAGDRTRAHRHHRLGSP